MSAPQDAKRFEKVIDDSTGEDVALMKQPNNFKMTSANGETIVDTNADAKRIQMLVEARIRNEERMLLQMQQQQRDAMNGATNAQLQALKDEIAKLQSKIDQAGTQSSAPAAAAAVPAQAQASTPAAPQAAIPDAEMSEYEQFVQEKRKRLADTAKAAEDARIAKIVEETIAKRDAASAPAASAASAAPAATQGKKRAAEAAPAVVDDEDDDLSDEETQQAGGGGAPAAAGAPKMSKQYDQARAEIKKQFDEYDSKFKRLQEDKDKFALNKAKLDAENAAQHEARLALREAKLKKTADALIDWAVGKTLQYEKDTNGACGGGADRLFAAVRARTNVNLDDSNFMRQTVEAVASAAQKHASQQQTLTDLQTKLENERRLNAELSIQQKRMAIGLSAQSAVDRFDPVSRQQTHLGYSTAYAAPAAAAATTAPVFDEKTPAHLGYVAKGQYVAVASSRGIMASTSTQDSAPFAPEWRQRRPTIRAIRAVVKNREFLEDGAAEVPIRFDSLANDRNANLNPMEPLPRGLAASTHPGHQQFFRMIMEEKEGSCGAKGMLPQLHRDDFYATGPRSTY